MSDSTRAPALTIGSAMVDIIATIADRDVERMTLHNATLSFLLVEQGRKIEAERISTHAGGGGINVAVALRRLGRAVDVLVKVGEDVDGTRVREHLKTENIGAAHVRVSKNLPTGSAVLIASHDKDAAIYTQRGANTALIAEDIAVADFKRYGLVHVAPLSGASAACLAGIVARAAAVRAFVTVNPGIRQITTRSPELFKVLERISLLALNAKEAAALAPALMAYCGSSAAAAAPPKHERADGPALLRDGLRLNDSAVPLKWFLGALHGCGARRVLVTNGRDGGYLSVEGTLFHCPVAPAKVLGTVGAGDAFCSTLGEGLSRGLEPEEALVRAACNAAAVTAFPDAQSGLLGAAALSKAVAKAGLEVWIGSGARLDRKLRGD